MAARSCTPAPSRRALFGAAAALPVLATAPALGSPLHRAGGSTDDGLQFLTWEREVGIYLEESSAADNDDDGMAAWHRGWACMVQILTTPPRSRIAAAVKLRAVMHPEIGLFAAGSSDHDEPCLQQVAAFLGEA